MQHTVPLLLLLVDDAERSRQLAVLSQDLEPRVYLCLQIQYNFERTTVVPVTNAS